MLEPDVTRSVIEQNWMQGWHYGKGLIYLRPIYKANISANKISLPQGQSYAEGKFTYLLAEILALNIGLK